MDDVWVKGLVEEEEDLQEGEEGEVDGYRSAFLDDETGEVYEGG